MSELEIQELRADIATSAMNGMLANPSNRVGPNFDEIALASVRAADALIAALEVS